MTTPWGQSDHQKKYAEGVIFYSTPGHGGFKLSPERNEKIPPKLRNSDGWYEEDCEASIVITAFPEMFTEKDHEYAAKSLKHWYGQAAVLAFKMRQK